MPKQIRYARLRTCEMFLGPKEENIQNYNYGHCSEETVEPLRYESKHNGFLIQYLLRKLSDVKEAGTVPGVELYNPIFT